VVDLWEADLDAEEDLAVLVDLRDFLTGFLASASFLAFLYLASISLALVRETLVPLMTTKLERPSLVTRRSRPQRCFLLVVALTFLLLDFLAPPVWVGMAGVSLVKWEAVVGGTVALVNAGTGGLTPVLVILVGVGMEAFIL